MANQKVKWGIWCEPIPTNDKGKPQWCAAVYQTKQDAEHAAASLTVRDFHFGAFWRYQFKKFPEGRKQ